MVRFNELYEFTGDEGDYLLTKTEGEELLKLTAVLSLNGKTETKEKEIEKHLCEDEERELLLLAYELLCKMCSFTPKWGILTGVRPSKLLMNKMLTCDEKEAYSWFRDTFKVSEEKAKLALSVAKTELTIIEKAGDNTFSLYIWIDGTAENAKKNGNLSFEEINA
ncbi:MAG: hypothetical protein J6A43_03000, partial [Clostridia bacterium]|nr:hypothetical protein [Clostridia bacterium]